MKKFALVALLVAAVGQTAFASTVCTSKPNQHGRIVSITISENDEGQPTVSLYGDGRMAHFVTLEGPFVAKAKHYPDGTVYTFTDNFEQTGTVALFTSAFGGKLQTTASADFGMWKNVTMFCE